MELRHLRYFVTVAEELHFGRAAKRLHIQQPPLSFQIKQLEEEWKVKLFHRKANRIALTPVGEALLAHARDLITSAEMLQRRARGAGEGRVGHVAIGYVSHALYDALPRIARVVVDALPDLRMTWHQLSSPQQMAWLAHGRLDVGILVLPTRRNPHMRLELIQRQSLAVALPAEHPGAAQSAVKIIDLCEGPLFVPRRMPADGRHWLAMCQRVGAVPKHLQEVDGPECALALVAAGLGTALVPAAPMLPLPPGVVVRPIADVETTLDLALAWWNGDASPTVTRFLEVTRGAFS